MGKTRDTTRFLHFYATFVVKEWWVYTFPTIRHIIYILYMHKMKYWMLIVSCLLAQRVTGQVTVLGSAFLDNWSVTSSVGAISPLKNSAFWAHTRPMYGVELSKKITTVMSLGIDGGVTHGLTHSQNMVDAMHLSGVIKWNVSNLLAGYVGRPRGWELEVEGSAGWGHRFVPHSIGTDDNFAITRWGINVNWFLNENRSWAIGFRPAIVCNTEGRNARYSFEGSRAALELRIGMTYHFKNVNNGKHHLTIQRHYNRPQVDALRAKVNDLQDENGALKKKIEELETQGLLH